MAANHHLVFKLLQLFRDDVKEPHSCDELIWEETNLNESKVRVFNEEIASGN